MNKIQLGNVMFIYLTILCHICLDKKKIMKGWNFIIILLENKYFFIVWWNYDSLFSKRDIIVWLPQELQYIKYL